jgi:hypothetical protein
MDFANAGSLFEYVRARTKLREPLARCGSSKCQSRRGEEVKWQGTTKMGQASRPAAQHANVVCLSSPRVVALYTAWVHAGLLLTRMLNDMLMLPTQVVLPAADLCS